MLTISVDVEVVGGTAEDAMGGRFGGGIGGRSALSSEADLGIDRVEGRRGLHEAFNEIAPNVRFFASAAESVHAPFGH
jgi:hypothetical protein